MDPLDDSSLYGGLGACGLDNPTDPNRQLNYDKHLEAVPGLVNIRNPTNVAGHPVASSYLQGGFGLGTFEQNADGNFDLIDPYQPSPTAGCYSHFPQIPSANLPSETPSATSNLGPTLRSGQPIMALNKTSATTLASPSIAMPTMATGMVAGKSASTDQGEETCQGHTDLAGGAESSSRSDRKQWPPIDDRLLWCLYERGVPVLVIIEV
jgi:hypothetical protein